MYKLKLRIIQFGKFLVSPKYKDKDLARRELVLNILLCGSLVLTFIATVASWVDTLFHHKIYFREESVVILIIFLLFFTMYLLSRAGKAKLISYSFIVFYLLIAIYSTYVWGADLSQGVVVYALIIVMSGILINSSVAFIVSVIISMTTLFLINFQREGVISVISNWRLEPADMGDGIVLSITFALIALVSWLFNKETERALKRARASERELKKERDMLEVKVEERTRELKRIQLEKVTQLYRFAEIGQLTSGFMHDLVNPISLVSLNLHKLNRESQQKKLAHIDTLLKRAIKGTRYLENFVTTARKQLQNQETQKTFSLNQEIKHVIEILNYKARSLHIKIILSAKENIRMFGNPIKFNQVVMNLFLNAIDSYEKTPKKDRYVIAILDQTEKQIIFSVQDYGAGIPRGSLGKIFDPFFTTKREDRGTGIGLSITQNIVKKSFRGKISVKSSSNGTLFLIKFPKNHPKIIQTNEASS